MGRNALGPLQRLVLNVDSLGTQQLFLYRPDILWQLNDASGICLIDRPQVNGALLSHSGDIGPLFSPGVQSRHWQTPFQVTFVP